jgi:hypothetical protein
MSLSGQSAGTLIGALIGAVVGSIIPGIGTALGADVGTVPPVTPRLFPGPADLARLVNPLLGLPFRRGSRDPVSGALDCGGLVYHVLSQGRGLTFARDPSGTPLLTPPLQPVWTQRGHHPTWWLTKIRPWDTLIWHDRDAERTVGWPVETVGPLVHAGLVVNDEVLVSCTLDLGVSLFLTQRIADHFGAGVLAVLRPPPVTKGLAYGHSHL